MSLKLFNPRCDLSKEWESVTIEATLVPTLKKLCEVRNSRVEKFWCLLLFCTYFYGFSLLKAMIRSPHQTMPIVSHSSLKQYVPGLNCQK